MRKHTEGQWKVMTQNFPTAPKEVITGVGIELSPSYFRVLFDVITSDSDEEYIKEHEEIKANAKLIAAAPDLLEACLMAKEELVFGGDWNTAIRIIEEAINKTNS